MTWRPERPLTRRWLRRWARAYQLAREQAVWIGMGRDTSPILLRVVCAALDRAQRAHRRALRDWKLGIERMPSRRVFARTQAMGDQTIAALRAMERNLTTPAERP